LFLNIIFNFKNNKSVAFLSGLSASPWLEFRHFIFTVLVVMAAIIWKKVKWMGFDIIFKPFVYIAPISFGIYISHWFLIYAAHYFDFIENKSIRLVCYVIVCILFSYLIEKVLYPKIHNLLAKKIK
jgi:peptidoglycan/LPS O-acetylase OafA/YrhL